MKKMSKGMLMTALICGAVYLGGSPVYANELQEFALDEYVVTAARTETKLVDTPANISVVDAKTIEERHYQDVSEVLKDVPGANVIDSGHGASEKVVKINGDERVLVLVDGRRVSTDMGLTNSARANVDMNQLPDVNLIERIEVLKGAGSSLYGSDAVGGVVNIITKKSQNNYGKVVLGFGSNDKRDMSAMYSIKEGTTGVIISAAKEKQGYYKYKDSLSGETKRWKYPTDYENKKVSLKLMEELNDNSNLEIGYDYSKFDGTSQSISYGSYYSNRQDKETQNFYAKYDWLNDKDALGYLQIYHNELESNNKGIVNEYDPSSLAIGHMKEKVNGFDLQQEVILSDVNKLVVGTSYRKSDVKASGDNNYDESINNFAFFVNDTWEFAPNWTFNAGLRYDNHSEAGDETTMSAGLNKKINDNSHAFISWGQVFKAPSTDELYFLGDMGGMLTKGNPNLKAETGETWTLGYSTKINEKTGFGVHYFESDLDDAIDWVWDNDGSDGWDPTTVDNIDKQKKRGLELTLNHKINDNLDLNASYTYIRVENSDDGAGYVRDINQYPNTYRLGIRYHKGKWNANAWLRYGSGCDTTTKDSWGTIYGKYIDNNYLTVDLALSYQATDDLSIYAKGYNLFNETYAEFAGTTNGSYDYPAQSRRFIVGSEYKF